MGDFESNIDRAIDELFVHKSGAAAPLPEEETPAVAAPGKVQPPTPKVATDFLQGLKESLLSLDWEISADNIQIFERELDALKEKIGQDRHSLAVIKMALGVCKYLRAMKYSASAVSVQFLHSATRTLDLLQRKPQLGAAERRDLMDKMLTKFRRLKAEVQRIKTVRTGGPKAAPAGLPAEPAIEPLAVEEPEPIAEQGEELVLEPLPEAEEAAPEVEPLLMEEKEKPFIQAPEEDLELPAEQEEEPILPLAAEKPSSRYRDDTLELEPEDAKLALSEAREEEEPLARLEEVPAEPAPETLAAWRDRLDEARSHSMELTHCLTDLGQENDKLFGRLLQAVAGKAALQRVAQYFGKVHRDQAEKLTRAQQSAARLGEMLGALGQIPGPADTAEPPPQGYGVLSAQLGEIQESLRRLSESVTRLEEGSLAPPADAGGDELTHEMQQPVTLDAPLETAKALEPSEISAPPDIQKPSEIPDSEVSEDLLLMDEAVEPEQPPPSPAAGEVSAVSPAVTQIFLTNVAGTTIGIPIDAVSHVCKVSKGKAKALRKRGYATLVDFKAPFRSIKRGLSGPLAEQPVNELKKARFPLINLSPEVVGADAAKVAQAPVKGIVILSDGQRHGSVLTEDLLEKRPYQVLRFRQAGLPGDVMGTATIDGDFEINVLNLDRLLS
jgi:chemotaxis protein histidine kinase CheA